MLRERERVEQIDAHCDSPRFKCHIAYQIRAKISSCVDLPVAHAPADTPCPAAVDPTNSAGQVDAGHLRKPLFNANQPTIHFVIDVLLIADCCYALVRNDLVEAKSSVTYDLLERWTFTMMPNRG